jgi:BRCA1-associated protein
MTFGYRLLLETIEAAPAPDIEYLGMASGGEEPAAEVSFLSPPLPSVLGEQQKRERGERKPTDIVVETILAPGDESWAARAAKSSSKSRNTSKKGTPGPLSMDDRINFISGNPFVEVTKGVIHLYKLSEPVPDTEMMAMLGVPAKHKTPDLLQLTAPCHQDLEYIRIIHDGSPNQYMVLLKFKDRQSATELQSTYHGLPYNSLEPEVAIVDC